MPNPKEQFINAPYSGEQIIADQVDASAFLFRDMMKIATGKIHPNQARKFATESVRGAMIITQNAVTLTPK